MCLVGDTERYYLWKWTGSNIAYSSVENAWQQTTKLGARLANHSILGAGRANREQLFHFLMVGEALPFFIYMPRTRSSVS